GIGGHAVLCPLDPLLLRGLSLGMNFGGDVAVQRSVVVRLVDAVCRDEQRGRIGLVRRCVGDIEVAFGGPCLDTPRPALADVAVELEAAGSCGEFTLGYRTGAAQIEPRSAGSGDLFALGVELRPVLGTDINESRERHERELQ